MSDLLSKKCVPCEGGMPPLSADEVQKLVSQAPGWEVVENKEIQREFQFKDSNGSETYRVRIWSMEGAEIGGRNSAGLFDVTLVAPAAA